MIVAGIDIGSRSVKAVIWDGEAVIGHAQVPTGWTPEQSAESALELAMLEAGVDRPGSIVASGYGRRVVRFANHTVTEITAHAVGVHHLMPEVATLIDIGGQDSKVTILENGLVADFAMNDRCAAGSGKFLEFLAHSIGKSVEEFAELGLQSENPCLISSICTVFAESEMLSLLAEGKKAEDVACGVHRAIALRVVQMAEKLNPRAPYAFTGGVALNKCMVRELSHTLGNPVVTPAEPLFTGALGAAILAHRRSCQTQ